MGSSSALRVRRSLPGPTALKSSATSSEAQRTIPVEFMPAPARKPRGFLALIMLAALSLAARAAETTPPAAPAAAPAAPAPPSPAAIAAADTILGDIGIKQTIAIVVPGMLTELETNVTRTRPEIKESLRQTLR